MPYVVLSVMILHIIRPFTCLSFCFTDLAWIMNPLNRLASPVVSSMPIISQGSTIFLVNVKFAGGVSVCGGCEWPGVICAHAESGAPIEKLLVLSISDRMATVTTNWENVTILAWLALGVFWCVSFQIRSGYCFVLTPHTFFSWNNNHLELE